MTRDEAIAAIRKALAERSDRRWSVTGGRGSVYGWVYIMSPPARRTEFDSMTEDDRAELERLLGEHVHHQGVRIPASSAYRREYVDRAEGRQPAVAATPYWD